MFAIFLLGIGVACSIWLRNVWDPDALSLWINTMADPPEKQPKFRLIVAGGSMVSALTLGTVSLGLLLTIGLWFKKSSSKQGTPPLKFGRWFWLGVVVILVFAAALRAPRMSLSLYNDEVAGFSSFIEGKFDPKASFDVTKDEIPAFKPATWQDTAWRNHTVNNHALYSLLARIAYDSQNATEGEVREFPLRLPSLLGGLISIASIALLAAIVTENPRAGLFSGIFLALQPWHIRYSTEARGYGLLFGVSALLIFFLIQALRNPGKWRWWIGFALAQTACLWTYLGAVHLLVCVNLSVVAWLIFQARRSNSMGSSNRPCWIVATLFSAALFIAAMAPALAQIRVALAGAHAPMGRGIPYGWWTDVLSYLALGIPWMDEAHHNPANPAGSNSPVLFWIGVVAVSVLVGKGIWALWRTNRPSHRLLLVATPPLIVILPWVFSLVTGSVLLKWYVVGDVIFIALWMGIGLEALVFGSEISSPGRRLLMMGLISAVAIPMMMPIQKYRRFSKQQIREAVQIAHNGHVYPFSEVPVKPLTAGWWTNANVYDPAMLVVFKKDKLDEVMARANAEEREFYFTLGARDVAFRENPAVVETLENPQLFELVGVLPGLEQHQFSTLVFRMLPQQN